MPIFKINNQKVKQLYFKQNGFKNEFELRDFFADNLEEILGVRFIEKEFSIPDGRIDTIGIDENNSPVIIEYKWKENEDVLSQGLHYFLWLKKNKNHFELLVKSKFGKQTEIRWEQPRVILIAQDFNAYIKSAVQLQKNIELKTYAVYEDNILHIENEYSPYSEKEQTEKKKNIVKDEPTWVQLLILEPYYDCDEKKIIKDVTSNKWWYKGLVKFTPDSNVDYIFSLVRESYNSTL